MEKSQLTDVQRGKTQQPETIKKEAKEENEKRTEFKSNSLFSIHSLTQTYSALR